MGAWALYEYRVNIWRKAVPWAFAAVVLASVLPFVLWAMSDEAHRRAYAEVTGVATTIEHASRLQGELVRYSDFAGVGNQKLPLPVRIPVRGHIVLSIIAALGVLYVRSRRVFWHLFLLIIVLMVWGYFVCDQRV